MIRRKASKAGPAIDGLNIFYLAVISLAITASFLAFPAHSIDIIKKIVTYPVENNRFIYDENTVIDTQRGIMWPRNFHPFNLWTTLVFERAEAEVQNLRDICYLGYCDWRMPTERDFKSIIDRTNINPALVYPNPFENVETHYPYWTQNPIQELVLESGICANYIKVVRFWEGKFEQQNKNEGALLIPNRIHDPDKYYSR
jgi:hypothetical protein